VGDFDPEPTLSLIRPALQGWQAKMPYARIVTKATENASAAPESIETPDKANATFLAGLALAMDDLHPDYPALVLANHVLGGTSAARLFSRVREHEGLSYGVFSNFRAQMLDPNAQLRVSGICNPNNMPKVRQLIGEEVARLASQGVTKEELEEAKRSYLERRGMSRTQDSALGGILSGQLYAGRTMQQEADFEARLKALTSEQVTAAAKKYIKPEGMVIVTAGDFANASKYAGDAKPGAAGAGR